MPNNALNRFVKALVADLPRTTRVKFDEPPGPLGPTWVDVVSGPKHLIIEWHPVRGYGISDAKHEAGYGEGPESTFDRRLAALKHCRVHFGLPPRPGLPQKPLAPKKRSAKRKA